MTVDERYEYLRILHPCYAGHSVRRLRQDQPRLPQCRGRALSGLTATTLAGRLPWNLTAPGHFALDLAHHGGPEPRADDVCALQWIDVATGRSERGWPMYQDAWPISKKLL